MEEKIVNILNEMADYLNISQMEKLQEVMLNAFAENTPEKTEGTVNNIPSEIQVMNMIAPR